ncbi:hypothetical protein [Saccharolobus islandicus]|uniref:hypothetical protein n=1 Tax=Saccharolobus islandicus TaxID=43080 RepID=UPI00064F1603|nr:hypothetical protein [Sulfolobus islandicus]
MSNLDSQQYKHYANEKRYNIYCIRQHNLYLSREDFYKTIVHGHVLTKLRIEKFTPYGFAKTDLKKGEEG